MIYIVYGTLLTNGRVGVAVHAIMLLGRGNRPVVARVRPVVVD